MEKAELINNILESLEKRKQEIYEIGTKIYMHPETGFKEFETARLVAGKFSELGFSYTALEDIPGVKVTIDTGKEGPGLAVLGELDSVICREHPDCDKETGAVHACGHNAQIAAMLGAAMGLLDSGAVKHLSGKIHFIAVPAEEYIEVEFRKGLRDRGIIKYLGGKPELMSRGLFDDVDLCMMVHSIPGNIKIAVEQSSNGCLVKKIRYRGKASHAGAAPHRGINALYAANLGLSAINAIRETFQEEDYIRVHPIITKGGDIVNVIPDNVQLETFVRGKTMEAILKANTKVNRALAGGAAAMGAQVEIEDIPGYFPFVPDKGFEAAMRAAAGNLLTEDDIVELTHGTGSTDLGDLSTVMPVIQPYVGGIEGGLHSADFRIADTETAYLLGARLLALTAIELMWNEAGTAKEIVHGFEPVFKTREEYFRYADKLFNKAVLPKRDILE